MMDQSSYQQLMKDFMVAQKERQKTLKKIWGSLFALSIVIIVVLLLIFPNQFDDDGVAWILPVYGGMAFVGTFIGFVVSLNYLSEKPFFTTLYPELYQRINLDEGLFLEYDAYEKSKPEFVKEGGLFTRMATVRIRRHIHGTTEDQHPFDIYDCRLTTSNGKSQQVHFDGTYFVLQKQLFTSLQIRTNGSPKLKGVKFDRNDEITQIRVYKEEGQTMSNIDFIVLRYIETLLPNPNHKKIHCSVIDGSIHLAITYQKHPARKQKSVTLDTVNRYVSHFKEELHIAEELAKLDTY